MSPAYCLVHPECQETESGETAPIRESDSGKPQGHPGRWIPVLSAVMTEKDDSDLPPQEQSWHWIKMETVTKEGPQLLRNSE